MSTRRQKRRATRKLNRWRAERIRELILRAVAVGRGQAMPIPGTAGLLWYGLFGR